MKNLAIQHIEAEIISLQARVHAIHQAHLGYLKTNPDAESFASSVISEARELSQLMSQLEKLRQLLARIERDAQ